MHVLLADDHDLVRDGLRAHVQSLGLEVEISEAASREEVLAFAGRLPALDLILLDLNMPGMNSEGSARPDGMAGLKAITEAFAGTPVLVVSGYSDSSTVAAALRNGARGFVPKTSGNKTLALALRRVLDGEVFVPENWSQGAPTAWFTPIQDGAWAASVEDPLLRVSARESTVLRLLTRGLTNKEIALQLGLKEITVKVHLQHAYRKIGAANRADAVRIILQGAVSDKGAEFQAVRSSQRS